MAAHCSIYVGKWIEGMEQTKFMQESFEKKYPDLLKMAKELCQDGSTLVAMTLAYNMLLIKFPTIDDAGKKRDMYKNLKKKLKVPEEGDTDGKSKENKPKPFQCLEIVLARVQSAVNK